MPISIVVLDRGVDFYRYADQKLSGEDMKHYTIKSPSRKVLKKYWKMMEDAEDRCSGEIYKIEKLMADETGIKDIEFFRSPDDGCYCGIGNDSRTMKLIQDLR